MGRPPNKLNPTLQLGVVVARAGFSIRHDFVFSRKSCTSLQVEMDCDVKPFS